MDSRHIRHNLDGLKGQPWIDDARRWWPDYLFHCTELHNAANILTNNSFLSRTESLATGQLQVNIASPEIIAQTESQWQDYVRLYFRPRTPTQYANEGIRSTKDVRLNAHCAIPVYFLFDAVSILSRSNVLFTEGNVGGGAPPTNDIVEFQKMPFESIYHDTRFEPYQRDAIVHHRNAEVLVPQRLDLSTLQVIVCRSQAEYETLLHLLPPRTRRQWAPKIGVRPNYRLFHTSWTFVERVDAYPERLTFAFNRDTKSPGPFNARVDIDHQGTGTSYEWHEDEYWANDSLNLSVSGFRRPWLYEVRLHLDGHLAYANRIRKVNLPF